MVEIPVFSVAGQQVGQLSIDEQQLGERVRPALLKQAVVMYLANRRIATAHTRQRHEVEGSTRKLYRQKGTGNARMGAVRTPQRRGGGRAFGKKAKDIRLEMPKRMRRLACCNAVLAKILSNDVLIFSDLNITQPKTKQIQTALLNVGADRGCVLAVDSYLPAIVKSSRNIPKTDVRMVSDLNAYDILARRKLIFTQAAFEKFSKRVAEQSAN
ncbi:MAG: 50S ribosomal protein L4 [Phycisphaerae bacterium]|nr:50S ribosomal protein L4 [Phycisphaerae bacterium]